MLLPGLKRMPPRPFQQGRAEARLFFVARAVQGVSERGIANIVIRSLDNQRGDRTNGEESDGRRRWTMVEVIFAGRPSSIVRRPSS